MSFPWASRDTFDGATGVNASLFDINKDCWPEGLWPTLKLVDPNSYFGHLIRDSVQSRQKILLDSFERLGTDEQGRRYWNLKLFHKNRPYKVVRLYSNGVYAEQGSA